MKKKMLPLLVVVIAMLALCSVAVVAVTAGYELALTPTGKTAAADGSYVVTPGENVTVQVQGKQTAVADGLKLSAYDIHITNTATLVNRTFDPAGTAARELNTTVKPKDDANSYITFSSGGKQSAMIDFPHDTAALFGALHLYRPRHRQIRRQL